MIKYEKSLFGTNNNVAKAKEFDRWTLYGAASSICKSQQKAGKLFPDTANALRDIAMPDKETKLCIVEVGTGHYAVEMNLSPNVSLVAEANRYGYLRAGKFGVDPLSNEINQRPITALHNMDRSFIFAALIMAFASSDMSRLTSSQRDEFEQSMNRIKLQGICDNTKDDVYRLCDFIYWGINSDEKLIPIEEAAFDAGNIVQIPDRRLQKGTFRGKIYTGTPVLLFGNDSEEVNFGHMTMKQLMELPAVKAYREAHEDDWTEEERKMIPDPAFDPDVADDALVMPEAVEILMDIVQTSGDKKPMRNFSWRGPSGYGKSTGCKQVSRASGKPYLTQGCNDETMTESFMEEYVPESRDEAIISELPTMQDMMKNPILTYQKLTGTFDLDATPEMCLNAAYQQIGLGKKLQAKVAEETARFERERAYREAETETDRVILEATEMAQIEEARQAEKEAKDLADAKYTTALKTTAQFFEENSDALHLKLVEAPYARALRNGYLVEIQEASRIRRAAIVGLNPFDQVGALITKKNGETFRRHPEAVCIFTDNIGYLTTRGIDQSAIRRWRQDFGTSELEKQFVMDRIEWNVELGDNELLSDMYDVWKQIADICREKQIDRGSCTIIELENWVQKIKHRGVAELRQTLRSSIINKCTDNDDEREDIFDTVTKTCRILAA